jgi:hypothetical protein
MELGEQGHVRIQSIFIEGSNNYLLFSLNTTASNTTTTSQQDAVTVKSTSFFEKVKSVYDQFGDTSARIPMFLSSLTLQLAPSK